MKITFSTSKKHTSELSREFTRINKRLPWGLKKVAVEEVKNIMEESLDEVPRGTGALADSAFINQDRKGNITFGYGGKNVRKNTATGRTTDEYMLAVHERLDYKHEQGKAKFLEDPVNRHMATLEKDLANRLKTFFRF